VVDSHGRTVRLLLVEDSDIDAELLIAHLENAEFRFQTERVHQRADYQAALARGGVDVILSDYSLPDFDGLAALDLALEAHPEVPFIFVSGIVGEEFATNALRRGAIDYILKRNLSRVATSVTRALAETRQRAERRAAVTALQVSERNLRNALQAGRFGTWTLDLDTCELTSSEACRAHFGRSPAEPFTYQDLRSSIHVEDRGCLDATVRDAIANRADCDIEYRVVTPADEIRWVSMRGQANPDEHGAPRSMSGVSADITDRKSAELRRDALVRLTDRIRDIEDPAELAFSAVQILGETLNVSRTGYGIIDPRNETITIERDWNAPGIRSLAGTLQFRDFGTYIEDLLRGTTVVIEDADFDPRTHDTAAALKAISAHALVNMPVKEGGGLVALLYLNHAGPRQWFPEDLSLIREFAERTRTAVERLRISATLREREAQLREANETLEAKIAQRTAELTQASEALRQSQKMEAIGQLTGGIAHDFNNLLAAIGGSVEVIKRRLQAGRYDGLDRFIAAACGSTQRAASLTHRLLAFSRLQSLDPQPADVCALVSGMSELLHRSLGESIELETLHAGDTWPVLTDSNQLENAILNLAINARDAMPQGGRLTIETHNALLDASYAAGHDEVKPGEYVAISVSDTGSGMPPEVIAKAFDPFFTTKPIGQGTGLGLSMIYGFVKQSSGHVRIYSEVGRGTSVKMYLPRATSAGVSATSEGDTALQRGLGESVLVVEDEQNVRHLIVEVLKDLGYRHFEAAEARSAIDILESDATIDLLITDVGLPHMNGRQLAEIARNRRPGLKVLFITGYAQNAAIRGGFLGQDMDMLTKPFAIDALSRKLRDILETG
jgi:signal transduction histidine kinase/DNA-binding response OmpR family regulator